MIEIKPAILESEELTTESIVDAIANGTLDRAEATQLIEKLYTQRKSAALGAIQFAIEADDGIDFLSCWLHGEFPEIRRDWPNAPETVFRC